MKEITVRTKPEVIIVQFVLEHTYYDSKTNKYIFQFAGVSDKPSKIMKLQVWDMPFDTRSDAEAKRKEVKVGTMLIHSK